MTDAALARHVLGYFRARSYEIAEPRSVVSYADRSTLFISAGVQSARETVLGGETLGGGPGTAGIQYCVRMNRVELVGASEFLTSFRMITVLAREPRARARHVGALLEFLEDVGRIPRARLGFVLAAAADGYRGDDESEQALHALGVPAARIGRLVRRLSAPFGDAGPRGPNLFVYADAGTPCGEGCAPGCGCARWFHVWNMEFLDDAPPGLSPLLDAAGSLERVAAVRNGTFDTFAQGALGALCGAVASDPGLGALTESGRRQIADHVRTAFLLLCAGVAPAARAHGHVLRRLLRRVFVRAALADATARLGPLFVRCRDALHDEAPDLVPNAAALDAIGRELDAFGRIAARGRDHVTRLAAQAAGAALSADDVFRLQATLGVPAELIASWAVAAGSPIARADYDALVRRHRDVSRGAGDQ